MRVVKFIAALIIAMSVAALISGLVLYIDNGQSNFYVEYGGQMISSELSNIELAKDGYNVFYVKNVFGDVVNGVSSDDYEVTVLLCQKNVSDIEFKIGEETRSLYEIKDFTSAFAITKMDGAFTVYIPNDYTLKQILQACFADDKISITESMQLWDTDCFVLSVKCIAEGRVISIAFH